MNDKLLYAKVGTTIINTHIIKNIEVKAEKLSVISDDFDVLEF